MWGLWCKEWRSLRPFLALVVLFMGLGLAFELCTDVPHLRPLAETWEEYVASGKGPAILIFVLVFALASGLLVREFDDGTLEFLDTLPLSRSRVFVVKVSSAILVPLLLIALDIGIAVALHALSRNSLDAGFHGWFLATAALLRACQCMVFLSIGLAFSYLRRFGWLAVGLLLWAYLLLEEIWPPIRVFDVFALSQPVYEGSEWLIPWKPLMTQLALASVLLLVAYGLFLGAGDRLLRGWQRLQRQWWGRAVLLSGSAMLVVVGLVLSYLVSEQMSEDEGDDDVRIVYVDWRTARSRTQHYEFVYPVNLAARAESVVAQADAAHDQVQAFLGARPQDRIAVDMTDVSGRHAGTAHWEKVRMNPASSEDPRDLTAILAHETAHVYLDQLSESRLSDRFDSTRFFHEGVASYVEYHLFRRKEELETLRFGAAVMRRRTPFEFAELVDDDRWRARYDTHLVYPLGEMFVEALVRCHGEAAVGQVASALARPDAPQGLAGTELWRDVFQASGFSWENVLTAFFAELDEEVSRQRERIDRLPRLRGAVHSDDDRVLVEALWEPLEGWDSTCRFRPASDTPDRQYLPGFPEEENAFSMPRGFFPAGSCWYQLGLRDDEGRVAWDPWLQVRLRP